jgi:hypothetical protein
VDDHLGQGGQGRTDQGDEHVLHQGLLEVRVDPRRASRSLYGRTVAMPADDAATAT